MADFVFNIAKGRVVEFYNRVENNDPATSALKVIVYNYGATADDVLNNYDTISALEGDSNAAEVNNSGYGRKSLTDSDLAAFPAPDDTNNWYQVDIPDQTWTAVAAGTNWTDLVIAYAPDTAGADTTFIPCTSHDFVVTPDGSDITAQIDTNGFFRAS